MIILQNSLHITHIDIREYFRSMIRQKYKLQRKIQTVHNQSYTGIGRDHQSDAAPVEQSYVISKLSQKIWSTKKFI